MSEAQCVGVASLVHDLAFPLTGETPRTAVISLVHDLVVYAMCSSQKVDTHKPSKRNSRCWSKESHHLSMTWWCTPGGGLPSHLSRAASR